MYTLPTNKYLFNLYYLGFKTLFLKKLTWGEYLKFIVYLYVEVSQFLIMDRVYFY